MTCPSAEIITPDPLPAPLAPATSMVTTEGIAVAATAVMALALAGAFTVIVWGLCTPGDTKPLEDRFHMAKAPPAVPPSKPPTSKAAVTNTPSVRALFLSAS
jgi:hypothetical protein